MPLGDRRRKRVSESLDGSDVRRPLRIVTESIANLFHQHRQVAFGDEGVAPERVEDVGFRNRPWAALDQQCQQIKGFRREMDRFGPATQLARRIVERERPECSGHLGPSGLKTKRILIGS